MPFPKRVDANQKAMVKLFRDEGLSVLILSSVGKGCPDILLGLNGCSLLVELKDGARCVSQRKLTQPEANFHASWAGQVVIVKNEKEAMELVEWMRARRLDKFCYSEGVST